MTEDGEVLLAVIAVGGIGGKRERSSSGGHDLAMTIHSGEGAGEWEEGSIALSGWWLLHTQHACRFAVF